MFYEGGRRGVPSSRYGIATDVMETMSWTWAEYNDAPAELVDEITVKIVKRAQARNRKTE